MGWFRGDDPVAETGRTVVFEFPYRDGGEAVRATLRIRWEDDPVSGLRTSWCVSCNRPPWRLDGDLQGLRPVKSLITLVARQHGRWNGPATLPRGLQPR